MEPFLVSIPEAGRLLNLGRSKTYELIGSGTLQTVKIGTRTLVKVASIKALAAGAVSEAA